jgi:hypothetical protein
MTEPASGPVRERARGICTAEVRDAQVTRGDRTGCSPLVGLDGAAGLGRASHDGVVRHPHGAVEVRESRRLSRRIRPARSPLRRRSVRPDRTPAGGTSCGKPVCLRWACIQPEPTCLAVVA